MHLFIFFSNIEVKLINSFTNLIYNINEFQSHQKVYSVPTWLYCNTLCGSSYYLTNH